MTEYNGTTSLQTALEQLHGKKLTFGGMAKITNKYRERLNLPTGKAINTTVDKLKIYQWERDAITQSGLIELPPLIEPVTQSNLEPLRTELNITQHDNDAQLINESDNVELNITQLVNDIVPTVELVANELNIIHTQNDSKPCDKFISINYRHADNSRHTVQVEKFYIDALEAIGITNTAQFVTDNAGMTQVTRNVKRAIVNELVKRATAELNIIQSVTQSTMAESNGQCTQLTGAKLTKQCKNKAFKAGYCKLHYAEYIKHSR